MFAAVQPEEHNRDINTFLTVVSRDLRDILVIDRGNARFGNDNRCLPGVFSVSLDDGKAISLDENIVPTWVYRGRSNNDRLKGSDRNDVLWGDAGDDILYGYAGNDALFGGPGNDTLYGDEGDDYLDGGQGFDNCLFSARPFGNDRAVSCEVLDFDSLSEDVVIQEDRETGRMKLLFANGSSVAFLDAQDILFRDRTFSQKNETLQVFLEEKKTALFPWEPQNIAFSAGRISDDERQCFDFTPGKRQFHCRSHGDDAGLSITVEAPQASRMELTYQECQTSNQRRCTDLKTRKISVETGERVGIPSWISRIDGDEWYTSLSANLRIFGPNGRYVDYTVSHEVRPGR
jgi:hypothetical protein